MSLYHSNGFTVDFEKFSSTSNAKIVLVRSSNGIEVYFIADLEVHQIWREIVVKTL